MRHYIDISLEIGFTNTLNYRSIGRSIQDFLPLFNVLMRLDLQGLRISIHREIKFFVSFDHMFNA